MRKTNSNSTSSTNSLCRHVTRMGHRCRLPILDARTRLCFRHSALQREQLDAGAANLTAAFSGLLTDFKTASKINDFLSRLLVLLVEGRVSPRHAGVMAYINSLQLRTLPAIEYETTASGENPGAPVLLFDLPRPDRSTTPKNPNVPQVAQEKIAS